MSSHSFTVGQHVHRIEDRDITGATILSFVESPTSDLNNVTVELEYDEGGIGWWPISSIRADTP